MLPSPTIDPAVCVPCPMLSLVIQFSDTLTPITWSDKSGCRICLASSSKEMPESEVVIICPAPESPCKSHAARTFIATGSTAILLVNSGRTNDSIHRTSPCNDNAPISAAGIRTLKLSGANRQPLIFSPPFPSTYKSIRSRSSGEVVTTVTSTVFAPAATSSESPESIFREGTNSSIGKKRPSRESRSHCPLSASTNSLRADCTATTRAPVASTARRIGLSNGVSEASTYGSVPRTVGVCFGSPPTAEDTLGVTSVIDRVAPAERSGDDAADSTWRPSFQIQSPNSASRQTTAQIKHFLIRPFSFSTEWNYNKNLWFIGIFL